MSTDLLSGLVEADARVEVELDRPLRQDLGAAGGDERPDDSVETVASRVAAATTRSQVNMAIRLIR